MMNPAIRRKTFRAALALREMSQASWAKKQGITEGHLSHCLNGNRQSKKLMADVELFIRSTFNDVLKIGK